MKKQFTRDQLVRFGLYLLSDERKELYSKTEREGLTLEERLKVVNHADVENFIANENVLDPLNK